MKKSVIAVTVSLLLGGCSTIMNGTDQVVTVDNCYNEREKERVYTPHADYIDRMPTRVHISSGVSSGDYLLQVANQCSGQKVIKIPKNLRSSYWLNMFNVVGFFVDYTTGAMWEYPEKFHMPIVFGENCQNQTANSQ